MAKDKNWLPSEKNIKDYYLLKDMLSAQRTEYDLLTKKKADMQLNSLKVEMINRIIKPLKEIFVNEEYYIFLDILDEDVMPITSDVVLIISQFETAIRKFNFKYYIEDNYKFDEYDDNIKRWMTQEYPPDYYADDQ